MEIAWRSVDRKEFCHILKKWGGHDVYPLVPKTSTDYQISDNMLKYKWNQFEYELNDIGMYHFRYVGCGPWSKWTAM